MKDIFYTSSRLVAVILATLISMKIYGVHCDDEFPTVHHENQQTFFSDFPFAESTTNSDSLVSKECGISKYYRQRKPREKRSSTSIFDRGYDSRMPYSFLTEKEGRLRREKQKARIINGQQSRPGAWPWQVSLQLLHPKLGFVGHWCGGVLLNGYNGDYWVLTAAHCISNDAFDYPYGPLWTAVVGEHDRSVEEGSEHRIMVEKIFLHERFKEYHHDIALMKLQKSADHKNHTDRVRAICLPTEGEDDATIFQGVKCIATGWGQSKKGSKLENILHQTELPVIENSHCKQIYGAMYNIPINSYHLCAGPTSEGGTGTCIGDSGGPLQCSLRDGRWYLAGITSFGSGCAKPGFPDVFTRITYYLPWIRGKFRSVEKSFE